MKILNLYAGIGGNRKLWGDEHEITAVEYNNDIASVYKKFFPNDTVVVADAHEYLLKNYKEFDFIWSSPPCQSHSQIRLCGQRRGICEPLYPDMKLWQEIIFLEYYAKLSCKFVVENVRPYYEPFVKPTSEIGRHLFWSNFNIRKTKIQSDVIIGNVTDNSEVFGISLKDYKMPSVKYKKQILRNMVNPEVGKYILNIAINQQEKFNVGLFQ